MTSGESAIARLRQELDRYPAERYPVQHATSCFHLGVLLLKVQRYAEAAQVLARSVELFPPDGMKAEHGKARNMLGVALRSMGRPAEAAAEFGAAASFLGEVGLRTERGAALFNRGLSMKACGDRSEARDCFQEAVDCLPAERVPGQASAAARELGVLDLEEGDFKAAEERLRGAARLARVSNEYPSIAAADNALGLALLGLKRWDEAAEAFRSAAGANPRSIRSQEYAMAKANLGLALSRSGDRERSRLAARQALRAPSVPAPVAEQAETVLDEVGREPGGLYAIARAADEEARSPIIREEVLRWLDEPPQVRGEEVALFLEGLSDHDPGGGLTENFLGVLLELPPGHMDTLVADLVQAMSLWNGEEASTYRSKLSRVIARFHPPQMVRLEDALRRSEEGI
jgi:tetratricopeptide (TPR) repeat protein